jgi:hypothetical protein
MKRKQIHRSKYIAGVLVVILTLLNVIPAFTVEITRHVNTGIHGKSEALKEVTGSFSEAKQTRC